MSKMDFLLCTFFIFIADDLNASALQLEYYCVLAKAFERLMQWRQPPSLWPSRLLSSSVIGQFHRKGIVHDLGKSRALVVCVQ